MGLEAVIGRPMARATPSGTGARIEFATIDSSFLTMADPRCLSRLDEGSGGAVFDVSGDTKALWEQEGLSSHWHTSVLWNGFLYGLNGNNSEGAGRSPTSLRCLDWKTGEIKWEEPKPGFNGLISVGGKLLALTEMEDLVLVEASPDGYKDLAWAHIIEGRSFTAPVFAGGRYMHETPSSVKAR